jgi:hypothetical protein
LSQEPEPAAVPPVSPAVKAAPGEKGGSSGLTGIGLALLALAGLALGSYVTRPAAPEARVEKALAGANDALAAGRRVEAAKLLSVLLQDPTFADLAQLPVTRAKLDQIATDARGKLRDLGVASVAPGVPLAETSEVLGLALEATVEEGEALVASGTVSAALDRANGEATKDPRGAIALTARLAPALEGMEIEGRLREVRRRALEATLAGNADDVDARVELADLDLDAGEMKAARDRLEPIAAKLGDGEGARVLGVARSLTGSQRDAIALLGSYVDAHLPAFSRACEGMQAALVKAHERATKDLGEGRVSQAFARKYENSDDKARGEQQQQYIHEHMRHDPDLRDARRAFLATKVVVTPALALGTLELGEARGETEGPLRAHLERAEKLFRAIRFIAGREDGYCILTGKVLWLLGREKEAKEAFDAVVARHERAVPVLLEVARSLGEIRQPSSSLEAGKLAEEAFQRATSDEEKASAAHIRAAAASDLDERIAWLEKSGKNQAIEIELHFSRHYLALEEGRFDDARAEVDALLAFYSGEGAKLSGPHQLAKLDLMRFSATGERADLDRAIAALEPATSPPAGQEPEPEALDLLANALLTRAITDTVKDRVRVSVVRDLGLELLAFAAKDDRDLAALIDELANNADRKRALALREAVIAAEPGMRSAYEGLLADATARRDAPAILAIVERIEAAHLGGGAQGARLRDRWAGKEDDAERRGLDRRRKRQDVLVTEARDAHDQATLARTLTARATVERDAYALAATADLDLEVRLCEEAQQAAPRPYTWIALEHALLDRALSHARVGSNELERIARAHLKLGPVSVLALATRKDEALAKTLAGDADVKRVLELEALVLPAAAPDAGEPQTRDYLILAMVRDPRAAAVGKALGASKLAFAQARCASALSPGSPESVLEFATIAELRGEVEARRKALDAARARDVLLPYDVLQGP